MQTYLSVKTIHMNEPRLRSAAVALETQLIAEMLLAAGLGEPRRAFGGGAGEAQFSSMLNDEYASAIVEGGGLGLSEHIFQVLLEIRDEPTDI
ncbi:MULTISPECIES: rod-binding protein [unclassified Roseivivax]|uniref:rod-binding protein n=1 Tax=unclassified Roseivivax TaxID=2639302 RepID=UPI0012680A51|nr:MULTISPECIES: rod-binding protein [unclassified Roseivivax]